VVIQSGRHPLCDNGKGEALPSHRIVTRRSDEPKLEIGDKIPMEEGVVGVVLARYTRSGEPPQEVHYVVEVRRERQRNAEKDAQRVTTVLALRRFPFGHRC
jgi:hypothetical protein